MEIIKVGICLDDEPFAKALAVGLARESKVMRFYLLDCIEAGDFCNLILSEGKSIDQHVVQMVRELDPEKDPAVPPYQVYRYRESQNLINDLLFIYFQLTGKSPDIAGQVHATLVTFLSASGGCGTTSTALAAARMLYRIYGAKSLYLNLCPLNDAGKYLTDGCRTSLLKLLYYLDQEKPFPLESFITESEEVDYVDTETINTFFDEMKPSLMRRFLQKVDESGVYDFVIVDVGNHLSRENKKILGYTDLAVFLTDGERKLPVVYQNRITEEICKRLEKGRLIAVENFAPDTSAEDTDGKFFIEKETDGEIRLEKNYGVEISVIAREIMEGTEHGRS